MSEWRNVMYEHTESLAGYDIRFIAIPEDDPEYGDLNDDDADNLAKQIWRGELVEFCAIVQCYQLGEMLSEDILGSCIYKTYEEFHADHRDYYYIDMVRSVIAEAVEKINSLDGFDYEISTPHLSSR